MRASSLLLMAALAIPAIALADVHVTGAWSRALPPVMENGAAYVTVENAGAEADRILGASSPVAKRVEIHSHSMDGGVMKMRRVDGVDVGPGERVAFEPGGYHIMLIGLNEPLAEGKRYPLVVELAQAGPIAITVEVLGVGATGPTGGAGMHDHAQHAEHMAQSGQAAGHAEHAAHAGHSDGHMHGGPVEMPAGEAPTVRMEIAPDPVGGWNVHLVTERFRFAPEHVNGENVPGEGHAHLYLDDRKIARIYGPWYHIDRLPRGKRALRATLHANGHEHYAVAGEHVMHVVTLDVPGPEPMAKASRVFVLRLSGGRVAGVDGDTVRVEQGDVVELHWSADAPTTLEMEHYGATASPTGSAPATMRFEAKTPGRFAVRRDGDGPAVLWIEVAG